MALDTHVFKTFPEFSKLTFSDKQKYDALIAQYPPISDISFATLMAWRNQLDSLAISQLDGNLVISYWLPGDDVYSGLSLIGTHNVDESICTIFDYLQRQGEGARLIHVPEFVISNMHYPEMFTYTQEPEYDECILPIARFYPLKNVPMHRRKQINKFIGQVGEDAISVRSIDLLAEDNQRLLLDLAKEWRDNGVINQSVRLEFEAMTTVITNAEALDIESVGIYVNGKIVSFCIYQLPQDKRYVILSHLKMNMAIPYIFDYITYTYAKWFAERDISFVNLEMDWMVSHLRTKRLALGPVEFFRKYTIVPANIK